MIKRMWVNQPSKLQTYHDLHGMNVLANFKTSGFVKDDDVTIYFLSGPVISQIIDAKALADGWRSS